MRHDGHAVACRHYCVHPGLLLTAGGFMSTRSDDMREIGNWKCGANDSGMRKFKHK
jgi:hypothetical protein